MSEQAPRTVFSPTESESIKDTFLSVSDWSLIELALFKKKKKNHCNSRQTNLAINLTELNGLFLWVLRVILEMLPFVYNTPRTFLAHPKAHGFPNLLTA